MRFFCIGLRCFAFKVSPTVNNDRGTATITETANELAVPVGLALPRSDQWKYTSLAWAQGWPCAAKSSHGPCSGREGNGVGLRWPEA
jgi:hypothetical protein